MSWKGRTLDVASRVRDLEGALAGSASRVAEQDERLRKPEELIEQLRRRGSGKRHRSPRVNRSGRLAARVGCQERPMAVTVTAGTQASTSPKNRWIEVQ